MPLQLLTVLCKDLVAVDCRLSPLLSFPNSGFPSGQTRSLLFFCEPFFEPSLNFGFVVLLTAKNLPLLPVFVFDLLVVVEQTRDGLVAYRAQALGFFLATFLGDPLIHSLLNFTLSVLDCRILVCLTVFLEGLLEYFFCHFNVNLAVPALLLLPDFEILFVAGGLLDINFSDALVVHVTVDFLENRHFLPDSLELAQIQAFEYPKSLWVGHYCEKVSFVYDIQLRVVCSGDKTSDTSSLVQVVLNRPRDLLLAQHNHSDIVVVFEEVFFGPDKLGDALVNRAFIRIPHQPILKLKLSAFYEVNLFVRIAHLIYPLVAAKTSGVDIVEKLYQRR